MKKSFIILCFLFGAALQPSMGQSLKSAAKTASNIAGHLRGFDIVGTWIYDGVDVQFQSSNLLKKAGGAAAAKSMEKRVDNHLSALGFVEGLTTFEFREDGTFANTMGTTTLKGTYTLDTEEGTIKLAYYNAVPVKANVSTSSKSISLLYSADAFLSVFSFIGSHSGVGVLGTLGSILNSYDGMMVGVKLVKQ